MGVEISISRTANELRSPAGKTLSHSFDDDDDEESRIVLLIADDDALSLFPPPPTLQGRGGIVIFARRFRL